VRACIVHQDVHSAPLVHRRANAALGEVICRHVACQRGRVAAVALDGFRHLQRGGEGFVCQPGAHPWTTERHRLYTAGCVRGGVLGWLTSGADVLVPTFRDSPTNKTLQVTGRVSGLGCFVAVEPHAPSACTVRCAVGHSVCWGAVHASGQPILPL